MRSDRGSIFTLKGHNKWLFGAMLFSFAAAALVIYVKPLARLFGFTSISFVEYAASIGMALLLIPVVEIVKPHQRKITARLGLAIA